HKADIKDLEQIESYFKNVDVVFHLAAEPRLQLSVENPVDVHKINVTGTLNILEAANRMDVDEVIFSSTCAVYGDQELPISEDVDENPKSPYGLHKLMGERYCDLYSRLYDLDTVILRYFNVFGPRKLAEGGYPMVIPKFLRQKQEDKPLTIVGDGKQTRDYIYVDDVVRANMRAWQAKGVSGEVFNVASGIQVSVNEIADIIGGPTTGIPERPGEMRFIEADISKAKKELDWEPQVEFEEGMDRLMEEWGVEK
ncbi:MAG: NAD-dependent epimerase/dehydratase family protein, partial [Candidatus Magasanikbacteria bacterium]